MAWAALPVAAVALAGCGSGVDAAPDGADLSPVVVDLAGAAPSAAPAAGSSVAVDPTSLTDPRADLDIDDQVGDGSSVVIESVDTDLPAVHVVIMGEDGSVLGSVLRTAGLQPVTLRLDRPVPGPTELMGRMLADDGDGILELGVDRPVIDDEGEQVAEDFDYVFSPDQLADD
jgi:hypothetical protein